MPKYLQLTAMRIVDEKLTEKQLVVLTEAIMTMEPDMLKTKDALVPVVYVQAAYNGVLLTIVVKEKLDIIIGMMTVE